MTVTPIMLKAAWHEARRWWPKQIVEMRACPACQQSKGFRVKETAIHVDEPMPGFREAIQAALDAMPIAHAIGADGEAGSEPKSSRETYA